jgi:hypothetical protein
MLTLRIAPPLKIQPLCLNEMDKECAARPSRLWRIALFSPPRGNNGWGDSAVIEDD